MRCETDGDLVLITGQDISRRPEVATGFRRRGYAVEFAETTESVMAFLENGRTPEAVVLDFTSLQTGLDVLREVRQWGYQKTVILCGTSAPPFQVVEAMKSGA